MIVASQSGESVFNTIRRWSSLHPYWTLTFIVLAVLVPFLAKPFNVDDPLFIWTARQISAHPGDPYGFNVNWYWTPLPMWSVMENPPLVSYYLALAAGIFGWSEISLRFACLLPAIAAILGTHRLAKRFCDQPMLAALATLFTPVFLLSSTTVMCDMPMLAFWVWAMVFWVEGMEQNSFWKLSASGLLVALAVLTKYYGVCLLPLLIVYAMLEKCRPGRWCLYLLIPMAAICAYQWVTYDLYGHALFSKAIHYAGDTKNILGVSKITAGLTTLTFTGGCVAVAFFFAPLFWRQAGLVLVAFGFFAIIGMFREYVLLQRGSWAAIEFQIIFWMTGGLFVILLIVSDVLHNRNSRSWLLALWLLGTFSFTAFFNWTVNGRSLLPMAPVIGILIARRLGRDVLTGRKISTRKVMICFTISALFALLVTRADYLLAVAVRQSVREVCAYHGSQPGKLWFQGHWGFQYYMQECGALAMDIKHSALKPGDFLALPANNTNLLPPDSKTITLLKTFDIPGPGLLTTWNARTGAGFFFASVQGPLPFAFGTIPPERVAVYGLKKTVP